MWRCSGSSAEREREREREVRLFETKCKKKHPQSFCRQETLLIASMRSSNFPWLLDLHGLIWLSRKPWMKKTQLCFVAHRAGHHRAFWTYAQRVHHYASVHLSEHKQDAFDASEYSHAVCAMRCVNLKPCHETSPPMILNEQLRQQCTLITTSLSYHHV